MFLVRGEVVEIETWCQGEGRIGTRRDFIINDLATGDVIGRATRYLFIVTIISRLCCISFQ